MGGLGFDKSYMGRDFVHGLMICSEALSVVNYGLLLAVCGFITVLLRSGRDWGDLGATYAGFTSFLGFLEGGAAGRRGAPRRSGDKKAEFIGFTRKRYRAAAGRRGAPRRAGKPRSGFCSNLQTEGEAPRAAVGRRGGRLQ